MNKHGNLKTIISYNENVLNAVQMIDNQSSHLLGKIQLMFIYSF